MAANPRFIQTASHWGVYDVAFDSGGRASVRGAAHDPAPSPLIHGLPAIVRGALRIARPAVREGYLRHGPGVSSKNRGRERFVEVSWDEALALVAGELQRVRGAHGHQAVYGGSYGWASAGRMHNAPVLVKRFLGLGGGFTDKLGNHSFGAAMAIMPYVVGRGDVPNLASDWRAIVGHTELFVMFGGAHPKNLQLDSGGLTRHTALDWMHRAHAAGTRFVNIGPAGGDTDGPLGADWIAIRPNTDVAFMLGLAHTLATGQLADTEFLTRYCTGYDVFRRYLLGESDGVPKTAEWAAGICDTGAEGIRALARRMAASRTMLGMGWSVQRSHHGEQPCWMVTTLAAMLGQIGLPGGGFGLGFGATNGIAAPRPEGIPRPKMSPGVNPVKSHVPVGRVADMLLNPGETIAYNGAQLTYPDIRLLYCCGGNPFHHNAELGKLARGWQRPETVVVQESWWNAAAKLADIVLPATTSLERNDILAADLDRFYIAMKQAMPPVGEARNDYDIFSDLAARLGYESAFTEGRDEMAWLRHMYDEAARATVRLGIALPSFEEFWERGSHEFAEPDAPRVLFADFRNDPDAHPLRTPSGKIEIVSEKIAGFGYDDCPGHPVWLEPAEWLGSPLAERFPFHLLSNQPRTRLHSQLDPAPLSRADKVAGREPLHLHPEDAAGKSLREGDLVRVWNDRGALVAGVRFDAGLKRGVAQIATGAWYDPVDPGVPGTLDRHGNPNALTLDLGTSQLAQSTSVQSLLVQIERIDSAPAVQAFEPPALVSRATPS
ncbi:MAG: Asp-tRNA(Asn)/Glu-tRNA(Gln) amidotransferase GatCAB subunit C [Betaproteobacteria bacterium]|nr:Asp-tRNA(Asn)/Glu-tRNA(Gln) amidotransferase GatCAB subunit C [Betaproteobacteria bacterium]